MNRMKSTKIRRALSTVIGLTGVVAFAGVALASGGGEEHSGPTPVPWNDMIEAFVNFAIFAGLLYYFLKRPVKTYLEKRAQTISGQLEEAAVLRKQAEEKLAEYRAKLERIEEERKKIIEGYERKAKEDRDEIVAEAQQLAKRLQSDAEIAIAYEIRQAQRELRERIVDEAVEIARENIEKRLDTKALDRLVDECTDDLAQAGERASV